jgi:hypothetical protein
MGFAPLNPSYDVIHRHPEVRAAGAPRRMHCQTIALRGPLRGHLRVTELRHCERSESENRAALRKRDMNPRKNKLWDS